MLSNPNPNPKLNPNQVLLSDAEVTAEIRIVDLGLARFFGPEERMMHTVCGTRKYLAPEIVRCDRGEAHGYGSAAVAPAPTLTPAPAPTLTPAPVPTPTLALTLTHRSPLTFHLSPSPGTTPPSTCGAWGCSAT